jgi:hypothetical protein
MKNKYDIYSLEPRQSKNQKEKKAETHENDPNKETFVYSLLRYLMIWFFIGVCMLLIFLE